MCYNVIKRRVLFSYQTKNSLQCGVQKSMLFWTLLVTLDKARIHLQKHNFFPAAAPCRVFFIPRPLPHDYQSTCHFRIYTQIRPCRRSSSWQCSQIVHFTTRSYVTKFLTGAIPCNSCEASSAHPTRLELCGVAIINEVTLCTRNLSEGSRSLRPRSRH